MNEVELEGFCFGHEELNINKKYTELSHQYVDRYQKPRMLHEFQNACLFSHVELVSENLGSMSDEQGERFHQDTKEMETMYQ